MRANKLKPLPKDPPASLSVAGRRVWSVVLTAIKKAGYDRFQFLIGAGMLSDSYGDYLRACELKPAEYADARVELIDLRREMLLRILSEFPGVELPYIEAGDELRAHQLGCRCELREIEAAISETTAESERWHGLLRTQSSLHWRLVTLCVLIDVEDDRRAETQQEADDDDSGEEWKGGGA